MKNGSWRCVKMGVLVLWGEVRVELGRVGGRVW